MKQLQLTTKKKTLVVVICILVFFLALGLTLYPIIASYYSEQHQSEIHTVYEEKMKEVEDDSIIDARQRAIEYNALLVPGVRNDSSEAFSIENIEKALESYGEQLNLADNGIMGYVEIPKMNIMLPIYHGTSEATLELGVGHLVGSSLPIGGESTHSLLTGHSGMANQRMFSDLPEMKLGDVFYLDILNETLAYQVDHIVTVLPEDTSYLQIEQGKDYCTLITCTPFGINTHRLLVRGSRIPYIADEKVKTEEIFQQEVVQSTWQRQYFIGIFAGIILVILALCLGIFLSQKKKRYLGKF